VARVRSPGGGIQRVPIPDCAVKPLNRLQVTSLLDCDEDIDTLLSRVAASSRLVIDAGPVDPL
jgi:hypothetical protein